MMNDRHADRERVLGATDLVALIGEFVPLHRKGREHVGLCPFHDDHSPSMHVVSHKGEHFYKCFSCGAGGNAIDFVINYHKMSFIEALRHLAERAGIELSQPERIPDAAAEDGGISRAKLLEANAFALQFFQGVLRHEKAGAPARAAIAHRGISDDMVLRFGLGAAPDDWEGLTNLLRKRGHNLAAFREAGLLKERAGGGVRDTFVNRLTFSISDQLGRPIAFGGRILNPDDQPKYLNSPESRLFEKGKVLYGLHQAQKSIRDHGEAIIAEGYIDVIALHQHGFTNAVATLGTALTREHAKILQRLCHTVIILFDGDVAGQKAADRAVETLTPVFCETSLGFRVCVLPEGLDPDDLLRKDQGKLEIRKLLDTAPTFMSFLAERVRREQAKASGPGARQQSAEAILARLGEMGLGAMSGLRKRLVLPSLADELGMTVEELERLLPRRRPRVVAESKPAAESGAPLVNALRVDVDGNPLPRQRAQAEADLLAYLLFEPALFAQPVDAGDGHMLAVTEAYLSDSFIDPACRAIYAAMHDMVEAGEQITVPAVQQRLDDNHHRALVATLFFRGSELCGDDDSRARDQFASLAAAFDRVRDGERLLNRFSELKSTAPPRGWSIEVIRQRAEHGPNLAAAPRRARSTP
jgi:DNA primase